MENFVSAVSNALQSAPVHWLITTLGQGTASTLNASAASVHTAVTTDHLTNSGVLRCSSLTWELQCIMIGSYGDTHAGGIKYSPKDK